MKKAATLVAGLLLVTGTVFAESKFKVDLTGGVLYENTIFKTDTAILQHEQVGESRADKNADQTFKADLQLTFTEKDVVNVTVENKDNDDKEDLTLKYTHTAERTKLTVETNTMFEETDFTVVNTSESGKVKAQIKGTLNTSLYANGSATPDTDGNINLADGKSEFALSTDADDVFLEYKATKDVTVTFYPYATEFGTDTVFNHEDDLGEFVGIDTNKSDTEYETIAEKPGIKVAGYGAEVKVGTSQDNADTDGKDGDATYFLDFKYSKTFGKVTATVDAATTTDEKGSEADYKTVVGAKVEAKELVKGLTLVGEALISQDNNDASEKGFNGLYAMAEYKMDALTLTGKVISKQYGKDVDNVDDEAMIGVYAGAEYELAEVNGLKPTVKASYEDRDLDEDGYIVKASVDAKLEKDNLTFTPSVELEKETDEDAVTTAKIAVAYKF